MRCCISINLKSCPIEELAAYILNIYQEKNIAKMGVSDFNNLLEWNFKPIWFEQNPPDTTLYIPVDPAIPQSFKDKCNEAISYLISKNLLFRDPDLMWGQHLKLTVKGKVIQINKQNNQIIFEPGETELLESKIYLDSLTGIWNRRYIEEKIRLIFDGNEHISIIFLDIDNFKKFNDIFGHSVGDTVLRAFSRCRKEFLLFQFQLPKIRLIPDLP